MGIAIANRKHRDFGGLSFFFFSPPSEPTTVGCGRRISVLCLFLFSRGGFPGLVLSPYNWEPRPSTRISTKKTEKIPPPGRNSGTPRKQTPKYRKNTKLKWAFLVFWGYFLGNFRFLFYFGEGFPGLVRGNPNMGLANGGLARKGVD